MARIEIPTTQAVVTGVAAPAATPGNSSENHFIAGNDGKIILEVTNADAAATHTVTILTPAEAAGNIPIEDPVTTVAKSGTSYIGPFRPQVCNQSNGQVYVNVNSSELKLRAIRV